jgi:hypothetical protein
MDDEDLLEMRIVASYVERIHTVSSVPRISKNLTALETRSDGRPNNNPMQSTEQGSTV